MQNTLTLNDYKTLRGFNHNQNTSKRRTKLALRKLEKFNPKPITINKVKLVERINDTQYVLKSSASRWIKKNTEKYPKAVFTIKQEGEMFVVTNN